MTAPGPGPARTFLRTHWPWVVYGALGLVILFCAAAVRFGMPQTPIFDGDGWGYLAPAFEKLDGGAFAHTFARNFLYPAFLFAALCAWGQYEAVCVCQHALGLLTGVEIALAWNVLCALVTGVSGRARTVARFAGLLLAADFLFSRNTLLFEHTLRPESVFPLAMAGSILLNLCALHAGYVVRRPVAERWCLGVNFFVVAVAQSLKPSFGFAVAAANLPMLVWLCRRDIPWAKKTLVTAAALAVCTLMLWLPERLLARDDPFALTFFPTMLFTIHAPAIHAQIVDDLRTGDTAPYPADWLAEFNRHLESSFAVASSPAIHPWRLLGFNADHLIYQDSVFTPAFPPQHDAEVGAFCMHYYWKTWRHRPAPMLGKIVTELGAIYDPRPGFLTSGHFNAARAKAAGRPEDYTHGALSVHRAVKWFGQRLTNITDPYTRQVQRPLSYDYKQSVRCVENVFVHSELDRSRYGASYERRLQRLTRTHAVVRQYQWVGYLNNVLGLLHVPTLLLALACGGILLAWRRTGTPVVVAAVGLLFAVNFAAFLTVAVAHSFDISRYVDNQWLPTVFSEFAAGLLAWQCAVVFVERRRAVVSRAVALEALTPMGT